MKIRSLSNRISLLVGATTVLLLGSAALFMDHRVDADMQRRFDETLLSRARTLAALVDTGPGGSTLDGGGRFPSRLLASEASAAYVIRCSDGSDWSSQPTPAQVPADWVTQARVTPAFADIHGGGPDLRAVWFRFRADSNGAAMATTGTDCRVVFMQPRAELDDILVAIDGILLLVPMLALLAVLALSPVLVRRGLRPLALLGERMRDVGPQAPGTRLQATGTRELEPLVRRFNEVLARMDDGVARERQFADALAHETRTRLAELRTLVEVESRYPSGRALDELLHEIGNIGGELENTVSALLLLTRLDAGIEDIGGGPANIDDLVAQQLDRLSATLRQRRLHVDVAAAGGDPEWPCDPVLLGIVVGNLLANAAAYAPCGSRTTLHTDAEGLVVGNPAPDLDPADVPKLGRRFWSKHPGHGEHAGLGLALAGAAAKAMGMALTFTLDPQHRLRASLRRP